MDPLLSIQNLSIGFRRDDKLVPALRDVSFAVMQSETVAVVGESGSGKSVTSLAILQLLPISSATYTGGRIYFSQPGKPPKDLLTLTGKEMQAVRGNRIAMIFQEPMTSLNPLLTCGSQVAEAILFHQKGSYKAARWKTLELFDRVQLPDPAVVFNRLPHEISGGQKQRVMIAMAMSCEPSLLIADEPTTALDVTVQQSILRLIRSLQKEKKISVIFISHDLGLVSEIADRVVVMYKGMVVEQNTVHQIFTDPQHPYTRALLACRPVLHRKGERLPVVSDFLQAGKGSVLKETALQPSRESRAKPAVDIAGSRQLPWEAEPGKQGRPPAGSSPSSLLAVEHLNVWFQVGKKRREKPGGTVKAVNDVSFTISEGESVGLVGESGCGKTTLGRAVLRLINPTSGRIFFRGQNLFNLSPAGMKRLRKDLQIIFQDPYSSLNPRMSIGGAILEGMKIHGIGNGNKNRRERIIHILEKVGLGEEHYNRYPHEFSGGQRQRIGIARALALNPSFIVCDESVSALDVSIQAQVLNLLNDLKDEFAFATLFISHDLSVVRYFCDRIMVMHRGKIEETGPSEDIYNHPQSAYAKTLIAAIPGAAGLGTGI